MVLVQELADHAHEATGTGLRLLATEEHSRKPSHIESLLLFLLSEVAHNNGCEHLQEGCAVPPSEALTHHIADLIGLTAQHVPQNCRTGTVLVACNCAPEVI